ncbi:MAG: NlpC/P60 family protein [Actinobacteria bacterium]|nr:NlpC/P60 family protein [Actinomycetota bacterium]
MAPTVPGKKAKLLKSGKAVAPASAPQEVKDAIEAANSIRKKPYIYGGGHRSFKAKGYDCSGAVSYVLNAAGLLDSPLPSGSLMKWGRPGLGTWITVYAHGGHTYAVIAGLRWDTSAVNEPFNSGSGPRWRASKRSPKGYAVRHAVGY